MVCWASVNELIIFWLNIEKSSFSDTVPGLSEISFARVDFKRLYAAVIKNGKPYLSIIDFAHDKSLSKQEIKGIEKTFSNHKTWPENWFNENNLVIVMNQQTAEDGSIFYEPTFEKDVQFSVNQNSNVKLSKQIPSYIAIKLRIGVLGKFWI